MRLWNLVTGKKAGVLNFDKALLQSVKEGKYSSGEGRKIRWNPKGTEFVVAFERGAVVFGDDSKPRAKVLPAPLTKVHQVAWCELKGPGGEAKEVLAMSTEDGRIVFYDAASVARADGENEQPNAKPLGQLGGRAAGITGRIKDFEILPIDGGDGQTIIVTASSDGAIRMWHMSSREWKDGSDETAQEVGKLVGTYNTGNRITCLRAFVMMPAKEDDEFGLSEFEGFSGGEEDSTEDEE